MYNFYSEEERTQTIIERYEAQKNHRLAPITTGHSHGKEYHFVLRWHGDGQKILNYKMDHYNGKLYYFERGYLFESNEDGSDRKILVKVADHFSTKQACNVSASNVFLAVNSGGIYLYQHGTGLTVCCFTLEGKYRKKLSIAGSTSQVYIAPSRIYYVLYRGGLESICYMDVDTKTAHAITRATKVLELYGDQERVVYKVAYETSKFGRSIFDEGWYLHDIETASTVCLSSANCPPHRVFECPEEYIEGHSLYIEYKESIKIRAVDLLRNIMWIATPRVEKITQGIWSEEYWEAVELKKEGASLTDTPIWRLTTQQFSAGINGKQVNEASYFDGTCFLNGRGLHIMKAYAVDGSATRYGLPNERGCCNHFRALNGYLYADVDGTGWDQYQIEDGALRFVRHCWFGQKIDNPETKALIKAYNQQ